MDFDDLDAQPGCRLYDIVVYGATGITGAMVAEHLDELIAAGKTDKKWAIAGRNEEKLKKVAKNCKTNPNVIKAETQEDLDWIAEVSTVIIATAGPYLLIGQAVVEACVKHSTHYIDVTGEIVYNRRCIDKYHDEAKEKGIMIVIMVGFMCALSDYNLYVLQQELGPLKRFHEYIMCTAAVRGGGSFLSGWSQFEHMRTDEPPLLVDPFSLGGHRKCGKRDTDKDAVEAYKSEFFPNVWCSTGFAGHPGVRVCRRSCELFENSVDAIDFGEEIVISSCDCTFSAGQAKLNAQMAKPPEDIKKIMSNAQAMEDGLMKGAGGRPGYGAPRETRLLSHSKCFAIAESVDGKWANVKFDGPEGYEFTAQAAVNGALVFVEEQDKVRASERGGVVTPSFAFHGTTWRERLADQSWAMGPGVTTTWTLKEGMLSEEEFEAQLKKVDEQSKDFSKNRNPRPSFVRKAMVSTSDNSPAVSQASYIQTCLWCVFYASGIIGMLVIYGVLQERIMTIPYGNETFSYSVFLVFCNRIAAVLFAIVMALVHKEGFANSAPLWKYLVVSLSNVFASTCQYESLKYVSFAVQMLGKSFKMMPVMLWGMAISGKRYSLTDWLVAAGVTLGVTEFLMTGPTASPNDHGNSTRGLLWLVAFLALDGLTSTMQEKLFKEHKTSKYNQMLYVNLLSCCVSIITLISSRTLFPALAFAGSHGRLIVDAALLSASAVGGQFFIYSQVKEFGALVFAATMNVRQVVSIIISYVTYKHHITLLQIIGLFICFFALFYKSYLGMKEAGTSAEKKPLLNQKPDEVTSISNCSDDAEKGR